MTSLPHFLCILRCESYHFSYCFPLPSCLSLFRLLHKLQPVIANKTQSTSGHLSLISQTMSTKSRQGSGKRGSFIFVALQTFAAVLHPHSIWLTVSSLPHTSQLVSTSTPFDFSRNFVGRMFLHALHMKCLILFGQSKFQMSFQMALDFDPSELYPLSPCLLSFSINFWAAQ